VSIYAKPTSQLTAADLQELLQENAVENARLEFKLLVPDKDDTLKKLTSFANTSGGLVVIGAKASGKDGRIQDLPGVEPENGYKQKIVQWCFDAVNPPMTAEVSEPITVPSGKVCYVISVPESDVTPHYINGRKGAWVRTDEFSAQLADDYEIQHLQNRRRMVLERRDRLIERARRRFGTYIKKKHTDKSGQPTKTGPILEIFVVPRFPTRPLCPQESLWKFVQANSMDWRQTIFPDFARNQPTFQKESLLVLDAAASRQSILEVNVWGLTFYGFELETDYGYSGQQVVGIHPNDLCGCVLLSLRHAETMFRVMGYSGPILISTSLASILDVPLLQQQFGSILTPALGSALDDDVTFSLDTTSEELAQQRDEVAMELFRRIFFSLGWPGIVNSRENVESLIRMAYNFNMWAQPERFQTGIRPEG
jgi:Schlafen, AlbA_2